MQLLTELDDETLKRCYMAWTGLDSEYRKRMQSKLQKRLMSNTTFQDPFTRFMPTIIEEAQKKSAPFIAESFVTAVRSGSWHLSIGDLVTDEAMEAFAQEILAQLGNPPELDKESMVVEMKRSRSLLAVSSINKTLGEVLAEMQRAQDIAEEIGVGFEEMLTQEHLVIEYLKRRYQPEEYRHILSERLELEINQNLSFAKSQIELLPFFAPPGTTQRQIEIQKMIMVRALNKQAKRLRKIVKQIIEEEIAEIWKQPRKKGFWDIVFQVARQLLFPYSKATAHDDLQRTFEEFRGPQRGIMCKIVDVMDFPGGGFSALIVQPTRPLTTAEKQEIGIYIKVKLLCEMPKAISYLKDKSLVLVRDTTPAIFSVSKEGKEFRQPVWYVRYPGGVIGPLTFLTDWDENNQVFVMQLMSAWQSPDTLLDPVSSAVIGRIARGYLKGVGEIQL